MCGASERSHFENTGCGCTIRVMEARKPPGSLSMNFYRGTLHLLSAFTVCALHSMSIRFSAVFSWIAIGELLMERPTSANKTLWSLSSMSLRKADEREHRTIHGAGRPSDRRAWPAERGCNKQ